MKLSNDKLKDWRDRGWEIVKRGSGQTALLTANDGGNFAYVSGSQFCTWTADQDPPQEVPEAYQPEVNNDGPATLSSEGKPTNLDEGNESVPSRNADVGTGDGIPQRVVKGKRSSRTRKRKPAASVPGSPSGDSGNTEGAGTAGTPAPDKNADDK